MTCWCRWDWYAWQFFVSLLPPFGTAMNFILVGNLMSSSQNAPYDDACPTLMMLQPSTAWPCTDGMTCSSRRLLSRQRHVC